MEFVRKIIREVLNGIDSKKTIQFPDVGDYFAQRDSESRFPHWVILTPDKKIVAHLQDDGSLWTRPFADALGMELVTHKIASLKNAVRYSFLKNQKPKEAIHESNNSKEMLISGLDGWYAIEHKNEALVPWWDFYDKDGSWIGYFLKSKDAYKLFWYDGTYVGNNFGNNYENAARYLYLKSQNPSINKNKS